MLETGTRTREMQRINEYFDGVYKEREGKYSKFFKNSAINS